MASIKSNSLFVVQDADKVSSTTATNLKSYIAPLAKKRSMNSDGVPGVMFPGEGLFYNSTTGELSLTSSDGAAVKSYVGLIGYKTDGDPMTPSMKGNEDPGNFYIVADFKYKYLQNDWGTLGTDRQQSRRVWMGDIVEKKADGSGDWKIIPMQIGRHHVHNNFSNYAHISKAEGNSIIALSAAADDPETVLQLSQDPDGGSY